VEVLAARLSGLDPKGPLLRGFTLVMDREGRLVTSSRALPAGADVRLRWLDGERKGTLS
jgi:exonuclease VII large subunit